VLVLTIPLEKRFEGAAQFGGKVFFANRVEKGNGGLIRLELGDTAGTPREVSFQLRMDRRRQVVLDKIRQQAHQIVAATFV
jgi:hypothetical protein